jgi:hypothetical protein
MGATWQPLIGPRGTKLFDNECHVSTTHSTTVNQSNCHLPRQQVCQLSCHVIVPSCHVTATCESYGLYGQVQSASFFFACLARRTDRDIFSIRTPFAKVNIPPESGKRDGRNGTIFVAFRAL